MQKTVYEKLIYPSLCVSFIGLAGAWLLSRRVLDARSVDVFFVSFASDDLIAAGLCVAILALSFILSRTISVDRVEQVVGWISDHSIAVSSLTFVALALLAPVIYHNHTLSMDEYAVFFQAKVFAAGKLKAEFPPELSEWLIHPMFNGWFFAVSAEKGNAVSIYWPGFSLLLTPFMKLGVPWLLNPLLTAGSLYLMGKVAYAIFEQRLAAGWAMLFALASPAFTINGLSYFTMSAHLFMNLLFAALLLKPTNGRLVAAGFFGSIALVLHYPYLHFLFALPWIVWIAREPKRVKRLALLSLGYTPVVLLIGVGWFYYRLSLGGSGIGTVTAYHSSDVAGGAANDLLSRFHHAFTLPDGAVLHMRFIGLMKLFLWAVPGLPLLAIFGFRKIRFIEEARRRKGALLLTLSALVTIGGYFFVGYSQQNGWGYRYFHSAWGVLPVLAAGIMLATKRSAWTSTVAWLVLFSLTVGTGLRLFQVERYVAKHLTQSPCLDKAVKQICFIDGASGFYSLDLVRNDPFLRDPSWIFASKGRMVDSAFMFQNFPQAKLVKQVGMGSVWLR